MEARSRLLTWLVATLCLLAPLCAQDKFSVKAAIEPASAKPGDTVSLVLRAKIVDGWHAYGTKESINLPVALKPAKQKFGGLEPVGAAEVPPGSPHATPAGTQYPLPQEFEVRQALKVPATMTAGAVTVAGELTLQICDANMCLPPAGAKYEVTLAVTGGATPDSSKPAATNPDFVLTASLEPAKARRGDTVTLVLRATVGEKYHAYGSLEETNRPVALSPLKVKTGGLQLVGDAEVPPGEKTLKSGFATYPLPHDFEVKQTLRVPADAKPGTIEVGGDLDFQLCDESVCLMPDTAAFRATLEIVDGDGAAPPVGTNEAATNPPAPTPTTQDSRPTQDPATSSSPRRQPKYTLDDLGDENALTGSWWALILLSIGGGLFALVMPCTYPMIPITFSFFTKQADQRGGKVMALAMTYGVGIVLMFVLIGVLVGGPIIGFAGHWATNLVIGVAFVVFAFSLFGFFTLQLPSFVQNAAGSASKTGGLVGVFLMGATLVITSFTCTAPIVGALLAGVAEGGYVRVGVGMAVFGLTMAAPFVFLALLPGRVKALPKSGEWMNTLKTSLGFVELAAALKFLSNVDLALGWGVLPREVFLMMWAFCFTALALFLFGLMGYRGVPVEGGSKVRNGFGLLSLAFAFYCMFGTMGFSLDAVMTAFEPPYRLRPVDEHTIVEDDHDGAMALAAREEKLVLVNFTGFT